MKREQFGNTDRVSTRIGLGLAALGRPGYITLSHAQDIQDTSMQAMEVHAHKVLDAAWETGIRYFDAARSYGRAEAFLSSWLKNRAINPEDVMVGSKWGYTYTANWQIKADKHEVKEHSLAVLERQWGETQNHLEDYLDLYQIHSATLDSGVLDNADVIGKLFDLKHNGALIGLSLSGVNQGETLLKALEVRDGDLLLFDSVQATWNLLETSAEDALIAAHSLGLGVIVKEVLANGRLTPRGADIPGFENTYQILLAQAERLNTTVDALAVAAALAQPWAGIVLSGAATADQLISNVKGMDVVWDDEAAQSLREIVENPEVYWRSRSALEWN